MRFILIFTTIFNLYGFDTNNYEAIEYLNSLRSQAGLNQYTFDEKLGQTAKNHTTYLETNNLVAHEESKYHSNFTGVTPSERAHYVGFEYSVGENLSKGQLSYESSIDGLFGAIYHRLGFLKFGYDIIGMNKSTNGNIYVYNMSDSSLNVSRKNYKHLHEKINQFKNILNQQKSNLDTIKTQMCKNRYTIKEGIYYNIECNHRKQRVPEDVYLKNFKPVQDEYNASIETYNNMIVQYNAIKVTSPNELKSPDIVIWPTNGQSDVVPYFFDEIPDPLRNIEVCGYPISVQFNPSYYSSVKIKSFKLYNNSRELETITLNKHNDRNKLLSDLEFAIFPKERLEWDTYYDVKLEYIAENKLYTKNWTFRTKKPIYPLIEIENKITNIKLKSDTFYTFYLKPNSVHDISKGYRIEYDNKMQFIEDKTVSDGDMNTIHAKVIGPVGTKATITFDNRRVVKLSIVEK